MTLFGKKLMTALRTSGVGKLEQVWREVKKAQVEAATERHVHAAQATQVGTPESQVQA